MKRWQEEAVPMGLDKIRVIKERSENEDERHFLKTNPPLTNRTQDLNLINLSKQNYISFPRYTIFIKCIVNKEHVIDTEIKKNSFGLFLRKGRKT